ncbi:hypothetical protein ACQPZF_40155 [Actinosynnema sp. CS-041913]|uniref:hypothetical protein n=1 Tax=Actinosynnema sp. CS-041913 TaxID=3239917 RepID=UPI003D90166B
MAGSDAVRRSGSLLLRVLAVGGLATAAWLVCGTAASAEGQDHPDEVSKTLDVVNAAIDRQHTATADLLAGVLAVPVDLPLTTEPAPADPFPAPAPVAMSLVAMPSIALPPLGMPLAPLQVEQVEAMAAADEDAPEEQTGQYSYSGGTGSPGYSHSGTVENTMPAEMYEAKVAAKETARQAAFAPPPAPAQAAPAQVVEPTTPALPAEHSEPTPAATKESPVDAATTTVNWEKPEPTTPAPAPKQAPAPTAPTTASSSMQDNSNGHRGGVIASVTSQHRLTPPTSWSAEQRDDWRSPGSVEGLPSTSPD